jgi:excisionase family DNA binding protein
MPFRARVLLSTKWTDMSTIKTKKYSISEAARQLGVRRTTLYKWIRSKQVPTPKEEFISGIRFRFWSEAQMARLKEYKARSYWGKGVDRRTGRKARQKKA